MTKTHLIAFILVILFSAQVKTDATIWDDSSKMEPLEDRYLFSVIPLNVVLVSDAVAQAEQIRRAATGDTIAIIYHSNSMTTTGLVDLLASVSAGHNDARIGHLGIVAHGGPGELHLGKGDDLGLATMPSQAAVFASDNSVGTVLPTAYEQYMLELINLARLDPAAEAASDGIALNEGLSPGTISAAAKQPLAFNPYLIKSAQLHSQWMLDTNIFSHTGSGGTNPGDRMANAGYSFTGSWDWEENIALQGTMGTPDIYSFVTQSEKALFVDAGTTTRGHRKNLMNQNFREVGVGIRAGVFSGYNAVMITQDFAYSGSSVFLTGVVYDDSRVLANNFYTPGEGLGGVTISATRLTDQAVFSTTTWDSGGYTLALPVGIYNVTASGTALGGTYERGNVTITAQNVKIDFMCGNHQPVADLDMDGKVNFADYVLFSEKWKQTGCKYPDWCNGSDFDKSGTVDMLDFKIFAYYWLEGL